MVVDKRGSRGWWRVIVVDNEENWVAVGSKGMAIKQWVVARIYWYVNN